MMQNYCDLSVENMLSGTRRRIKSKSESEFGSQSVTRERLGSMRYVDSPIDCLLTPVRRIENPSHPLIDYRTEIDLNANDEFMETPLGEGSSTRLEPEIFQPDWETTDSDLNYLEAMLKKYGVAPPMSIKSSYNKMMTRLTLIERKLQLSQQFSDILDVDLRRDRLYKMKLFSNPISLEDATGSVVLGAESLSIPIISLELDPLV